MARRTASSSPSKTNSDRISQGSQARTVTVLLPDPDSRLLTRELLYTAITRAQESVTLVGSVEAVRAAVTRRTQRATGLRHRV